jgi:hypothetical protein
MEAVKAQNWAVEPQKEEKDTRTLPGNLLVPPPLISSTLSQKRDGTVVYFAP